MTDFQALRESIDLLAVANEYVEMDDRAKQGPCPFCGGRNRFYIHRGGLKCGCRKCGFQGDVFDLVSHYEKITVAEAAKKLGGDKYQAGNYKAKPRKKQPPRPEWWHKIPDQAKKAAAMLASEDGAPGRAYLEGRGLRVNTWRAFGIGFNPKQGYRWNKDAKAFECHRPAIVIPWFTESGEIDVLKFRFTDDRAAEDKNARFSTATGSNPRLFGEHLLGDRPRLLIIEGEVNAMSAWQALHQDGADNGTDVLSIGADGVGYAIEEAAEIAARYQSVLVWLDDKDKATSAGQALKPKHSAVVAMASARGGTMDANAVLQEFGGEALQELIVSQFERVAPKLTPEQTRVIEGLAAIRARAVEYADRPSYAALTDALADVEAQIPTHDIETVKRNAYPRILALTAEIEGVQLTGDALNTAARFLFEEVRGTSRTVA